MDRPFLFCDFHQPFFSNESYLDLAGKLDLAFDLFGNIPADHGCLFIVDPLRVHHNAHLSPSLDGVTPLNAAEGTGDAL